MKYISLVNLIADREVVQELLADRFTVDNIAGELNRLLNDMSYRAKMLQDYADIRHRLGDDIAPDQAAKMIIRLLKNVWKGSRKGKGDQVILPFCRSQNGSSESDQA